MLFRKIYSDRSKCLVDDGRPKERERWLGAGSEHIRTYAYPEEQSSGPFLLTISDTLITYG